MTELELRYLDTFAEWLRRFGSDVAALSMLLTGDALPVGVRRLVAGGLNYVFKSLDLIPDGFEQLGYLDDAFVLRVASQLALREFPNATHADPQGVLLRLSEEATLVAEFLQDDRLRLEKYVRNLVHGSARGRSVDEIVNSPERRADFVTDLHEFAKSHTAVELARDEKNLLQLRSFFSAKLPA